jgi:hypothetical protein
MRHVRTGYDSRLRSRMRAHVVFATATGLVPPRT